METIRDLDYEWYWLGYSMGVNSRKKIKQSPDRITNMGKMGVITIPNNKQKTSFFVGLMVGRRKIINNLNIIKIITTIGKKGLSTADMLTLGVAEVEGLRGGYVDIPVYINKNAADNRGVAGFQLKLSYNKELLDLISITKSEFWTGSFTSDTSTQGLILAQGMKEVADKEDVAICFIRFLVKDTVPAGVSKITLNNEGSVGTGQGSELLTLINNEFYYITPIKLENGAILLEATQEEPEQIGSITYPSSGTSTIGTGNSSVSYDFTATVGSPSGMVGGGVSAYVNVYMDGVLIGQQKVPLEDGEVRYKGKIPINLPSLKTGKITYEIVVEPNDPNDNFYYVFIKAGALFILESEVKREEVGELSDLSRLRVLNTDLKLGSITTMKLVEAVEAVDLTVLNTDLRLGSILTMKLVEIAEPLDVTVLNTTLNIGSLLTIKLVETVEPAEPPELNGIINTTLLLGSITTVKLITPPVQFNPKHLETGLKLGSITIITLE